MRSGFPVALAALLVAVVASTALADGLTWGHSSLAPALAEARRTSRPLLVVVHTDWCEPCNRLDDRVFTNRSVQEVASELVTVRIDGDAAEGERMRGRYAVERYPTSLFLRPDGTEWGRIVGFREVGGYLETLQRFAEARGVGSSSGPDASTFHRLYLDALRRAQSPSADAALELSRLLSMDESAAAGLRGPLTYALAEQLVALGRSDEARGSLEKLVVSEAGSALGGDAAFLLARAHAERGEPKKGVEVLRRAIKRSEQPLEAVWRLGRFVAITDGAPAAPALRELDRALKKHPTADFLWDIRALVLEREGRLHEAIAALDAAAACRPGLPWYEERRVALRARLARRDGAAR